MLWKTLGFGLDYFIVKNLKGLVFYPTLKPSENSKYLDDLILEQDILLLKKNSADYNLVQFLESLKELTKDLEYSDCGYTILLSKKYGTDKNRVKPNFHTLFEKYVKCLNSINKISWQDIPRLQFPDFKKADFGINAGRIRKFLCLTEFIAAASCPDKRLSNKINSLTPKKLLQAGLKTISIFERSWPGLTCRLIAAAVEKRLCRIIYMLMDKKGPENKKKEKNKRKAPVVKGFEKYQKMREEYLNSLQPELKTVSTRELKGLQDVIKSRDELRMDYAKVLRDEKKYTFHNLSLAEKQKPLQMFLIRLTKGSTRDQYETILEKFIENPDDFWGYHTPLQKANFLVKIIFPNVNKAKTQLESVKKGSDYISALIMDSLNAEQKAFSENKDFYLDKRFDFRFSWKDFSLKLPDKSVSGE